jgi:2',3'-cyclic-nucleotide 2'-phosphodiesterase / 3'-nucleotidase
MLCTAFPERFGGFAMAKKPASRSLTRRATVAGLGASVAAGIGSQSLMAADEPPLIKLRLLETSDLHMFILDWDYFRVKPDPTVGFAKVATLIRKARSEADNAMLFDNGDFIQGSPLGDYIAEQARPTDGVPHPIVALMRKLGYDAAGLGNHEFNYGLGFLEASLKGAEFPFVCTNIGRSGGREFLPRTLVLTRELKDTAGRFHLVRIGVVGFVPPQILKWDKSHLEGKLDAQDIVLAATQFIPELRAKCDILVALCHSGIRGGEWTEGAENASLFLAAVPGIDVIFTGHSHRVFPGKDYADIPGVDAVKGTLNGVPAVMPGFWGSHLGVVDLELKRGDVASRWIVGSAHVEARPIYKRTQGKIEELVSRDEAVAASVMAAHEKTLAWVEQPVGAVDSPVHSYFAWTGHDPATALVNGAQTAYVKSLLTEPRFANIPVLASVAPFRVGYTPDAFVDIATGPVALREVADLYIYANNTLVAVQVAGAQILEWLEFSARIFHTIVPNAPTPQALVDRRQPSYNFDIISGVTYKIDVTKPPRYNGQGQLNPDVRRIVDLQYDGKAIDPTQYFIVVTNNYRADGGGNFPGLANANSVLRAPDTNRDVIAQYLRSQPVVTVPKAYPWSFAKIGAPTSVFFDTGKPAARHLSDVPGLSLSDDGDQGYARANWIML